MVITSTAFLFALAAQLYQLPTGYQSALCFVESSHNPAAMHKDDGRGNSVGICQIKLSTAKMLGFKGTENELKDPKTNILYSAKYLHLQSNRYRGDLRKTTGSYNAGSFKVNNQGKVINQKYIDKVFKAWGQGR